MDYNSLNKSNLHIYAIHHRVWDDPGMGIALILVELHNPLGYSRGGETQSMKNQQGFSLVELLIVVAIIAIIAAIAVPSLLTSKSAANEASAIQGCRTIGGAEIAYAATNNQQYTDLTTLASGSFIDARFTQASGYNGYTYASGDIPNTTVDGVLPTQFGFIAAPLTGSGRFSYGIGPDQVVRMVAAASGSSFPSGTTAGDPIGKN